MFSASFMLIPTIFAISYAQTDINGNKLTGATSNSTSGTFASALDLFVVPGSVGGYGVYEEHAPNTFSPGEDIVLYVEPVGFSHEPVGATSQDNANFVLDELYGGCCNFRP